MMDDEKPHQELVKCVLVGDNAVGKTRLICARACRQKVSLSQLLTTHVPTVWAIDQYRIYKEVLENSMMVLDGVHVSLRLWDTFGDHHKDRRFAYGRSDVILMCFDVGRQSSLDNCREMWFAQVKKFCPNTPIILVGCKNDVRFILNDPQYLNYCRDRSPLVRQVREHDLIMPDQGRAVAKELGVPYYETSVLTYFGVNEVFENAIRAALCVRRQTRFWMTNLRRMLNPTLQEPFCPPRPKLPEPTVLESVLQEDREKLFYLQHFTDVIFSCGSVGFSAHRFVLAAASPLLHRIFITDHTQEPTPTRSNSETSMLSSSIGSTTLGSDFVTNDDTELLISSEQSTPAKDWEQSKNRNLRRRSASFHLSPSMLRRWNEKMEASSASPGICRSINHPAIHSLRIQQCESLDCRGRIVTSVQTILNCTKLVPASAMRQLVQFIYTGSIDLTLCDLGELKQVSELLNIPDLMKYLGNITNKSAAAIKEDNEQSFARSLEEVSLAQGLFADVIFRLDDGAVLAHKPLLMARCDVMLAMFTHDDFVERSARVVKFPGISSCVLQEVLHYLYTDRAPRVTPANCVDILELANRLCLPRLVSLVEDAVIRKMNIAIEAGGDVTEEALKMLQPSQMHNAEQLSDWCLAYLAQNYNQICRKYPKVLRNLYPENQAWLNVHRWPPIWYLKDHDFYQRMVIDRERLERPKSLKRARNNSGCLCFSSKSSKGTIL